VLLDCSSVDGVRRDLNISSFVSACRLLGQSDADVYSGYVSGVDPEGCKIADSEHQDRGRALGQLQDKWLESWGASPRSTARARAKKARVEEES
jgi:hypothetical protein